MPVLAIFLCCVILTGCINLLEDHFESITEHHITSSVRPPTEHVTVYDYNEFAAAILKVVMEHETNSLLLYFHDGDDVGADIENARNEIMNKHPIGAFAVADLTLNATRIVTHYEIEIEIEYKRTKEQVDSIITVSSEQYLQSQLLDIMSIYGEEAVFRSTLYLTEEYLTQLVKKTYYQNPHRIVMLPIITVEIFPENGTSPDDEISREDGVDRIYLVQFGYTESTIMLQRYSEILTANIQRNVGLAAGNTESEILLSLVGIFIESIRFDDGSARTMPAHGTQNLLTTAFGALFRGIAVGEGFAMAFKAVADELNFDCYVVLGYYDDMVHAWNIISLYGDYYHVDVAMCVVKGWEFAFLKTDDDFEEMLYEWDRENTVRCEGELTLEDIIPEDEEDPDNPDNENGDPDEED